MSEDAGFKIAGIIVNYRTPEMTARAASALLAELATVGPSRLYIVDNDSQDGSFQKLCEAAAAEAWGDRVVLLESKRNGGYGYGINRAVQEILHDREQPEHLFVLNSDAFATPGSLQKLVAFMDAHPEVGVVGSPIFDMAGNPRVAAFRFPTALSQLRVESQNRIIAWLMPDEVVALPDMSQTVEADWISGTAMLIRRAVVEQIGGFDEGFFLYFEEVDFCRRARRSGWKVYMVADAPITHIGSASTQVEDLGRPLPDYWFDARERYFLKHHGRTYAALADASFLAGVAVRRMARTITRRAREERPGFIGGFLRASLRNLTARVLPQPDDCVVESRPTGMLEGARSWREERDRRAVDELTLFELLFEDFEAHERDLLEPGLWAIALHRLGRRAGQLGSPIVRAAARLAHGVATTGVDWIWGIELPLSADVGRRVRLWHFGSMLLNARSIGDDVQIRQSTTFGPASGVRAGAPSDLPVIEARADIGAGACVLGPVVVGHDAQVGANTLVVEDVPPGSAVLGVPARVIPDFGRPAKVIRP